MLRNPVIGILATRNFGASGSTKPAMVLPVDEAFAWDAPSELRHTEVAITELLTFSPSLPGWPQKNACS